MAETSSTTKQLKQTLGFWDLMGSAIGQIIGAGIMSLMPAAIATTGRSVPFSFLVAAIITVCQAIPFIFITSCVRIRGGEYTRVAMLGGNTFAGMFVITYIFANMSVASYCISFASYIGSLVGVESANGQKIIAIVFLTVFVILNLVGMDIFAKAQNAMVIVLIASLLMFAIAGIGKVKWGTYFVHDEYWMPEGVLGMLQAGGTLTFATGGATIIANFSAEAKNPTRDIPTVIITSTLFVAVMYAFISFVAAGVLPYEEVAGVNLTKVASHILPPALYIVFVIGGAGCALASTLNNSLATKPKPVMQMCDDGWLPQGFAALNKNNVPWKIQLFFYVFGLVVIISGLSVKTITNMVLVSNAVVSIITAWNTKKLPQIVPDAWNRSKFKVSGGVLTVLCVISAAASLFNFYLNASSLTTNLLVLNIVVIIAALGFGYIRGKTVKASVSYEEV